MEVYFISFRLKSCSIILLVLGSEAFTDAIF